MDFEGLLLTSWPTECQLLVLSVDYVRLQIPLAGVRPAEFRSLAMAWLCNCPIHHQFSGSRKPEVTPGYHLWRHQDGVWYVPTRCGELAAKGDGKNNIWKVELTWHLIWYLTWCLTGHLTCKAAIVKPPAAITNSRQKSIWISAATVKPQLQ